MSDWESRSDKDNDIIGSTKCEHGESGFCPECSAQREREKQEASHEYFLKDNCMKHCSDCGAEIKTYADFCSKCGEQQRFKATRKKCSKCGSLRDASDDYCSTCGNSL